MATFGAMKTWVSKRLQDPSNTAVSSSDVGDLINQALRYWKVRRFSFNEKTGTVTLVEADPAIAVPATWLLPAIDDAFVIEYSGIRYPLKKVSESEYNAMYLSNGIGQPWWFAKLANSGFQVYPIPDRDYTLRYFLLQQYDAFEDDADTNDFSEEAEDLLKYTAAAYGSRDLRQDAAMYQAFSAQAQAEYKNLLVSTTKNNATGRVAVYSSLMTY